MDAKDESLDPGWDPRREALKQRWVTERGSWDSFWEDMLRLDADFFEAYLDFYMVPWRKGHIPAKYKELIYIAIDASTTSLYQPGWKHHLRQAFRFGASVEEIMEVYQLVSTIGIHSCNIGVPLLLEEHRRYLAQQIHEPTDVTPGGDN
jgi:alkylhydroperoxidase/carboxymuconolactone decarboxylase family protein YurZ